MKSKGAGNRCAGKRHQGIMLDAIKMEGLRRGQLAPLFPCRRQERRMPGAQIPVFPGVVQHLSLFRGWGGDWL